jgi:rhodanese-related sulfurtransferase
MHVARFLTEHGFSQAHNLSGGIDAWARQVDRSMPTY